MTRLVAVLAVAALVTVGCGSGSSDDAGSSVQAQSGEEVPFELSDAPEETTEVTAVKSYRFEPAVIEIPGGAEVTWTNEDDFPHDVHFLTGNDETHPLPIGESVTVPFDESGEFYYECSIHPQQMRGKVIVTD